MLAKTLRTIAEELPAATACYYKQESVTYAELHKRITRRISRLSGGSGRVIGLLYNQPLEFIINCAAADALGYHVLILGDDNPGTREEIVRQFSVSRLIRDDQIIVLLEGNNTGEVKNPGKSEVTLFTSGTTGEPKAANHSWETLATPVRFSIKFRSIVWFSAYPIRFYAGLQVMLQALLNGAVIALPDTLDPNEISALLVSANVTHAAGTPTFWRKQLIFSDRIQLQKAPLQQITLGGEPVDQQVIDELQAVFPGARIVHIYASTEMGRLFSVHDGQAGFPAAYLEKPPEEGTELQIKDGQLYARSTKSMRRYDSADNTFHPGEWFATGDMVRVTGNRVVFEGRKSDVINVGGTKVFPSHIENRLRSVEGVADIRVYGRASSLVGEIVAADILPGKNVDMKNLRKRLIRFCNETLDRHQVPGIIRMVEEIQMGDSLKVIRRKG